MSCRKLKAGSKKQSHAALCWLVRNFSNKVLQYSCSMRALNYSMQWIQISFHVIILKQKCLSDGQAASGTPLSLHNLRAGAVSGSIPFTWWNSLRWKLNISMWTERSTFPLFMKPSHSPQLASSLPSEQSAEWSHLQLWRMHRPSPHWNSDVVHAGGVWGRGRDKPHNSLDSSRPFLQSDRPSHSVFPGRQVSDGPQEKKPAVVQLWQEASSLPSPQLSTPSQRRCRDMQPPLLQANSSFLHHTRPVRSERHSYKCSSNDVLQHLRVSANVTFTVWS